ncbi:hypothetical protein [Mesorhizobium sp. M7A.F.Ca.CA.004.02.1.1]|uniref:hypothetical protein n=1 Tax=Mesorhizobium sp. M7A.F.Ca.CA.004.02.1.1 TaxID=2496690 RepID=UPI000FCA52B2|nr:hypothetical protein [Mesorhizobium sp. M7A.F.Ca.CA.004.02.1.1]RVB05693.1 hypothetical protein EN912_02200 [Mesorhizobium sp. M7A.F.Ca.CA.004.02.1.1]
MSAFKSAFAAARKSGKKVFSFEGKRYTTKLATSTPKTAPTPTPKPSQAAPAVKKPRPLAAAPKPAEAMAGVSKQGLASRVAQGVAVGQAAVDSKKRRDAAQAANPNPKATIQKMMDDMGKKTIGAKARSGLKIAVK